MPVNPSSRFQPTTQSQLRLPAVCTACGTGTHPEGFVNPQIFLEEHGDVYLCWSCAIECGEVAGCLRPETADLLQTEFSAATAQLDAYKTLVKELREENAALSRIIERGVTGSSSDSVADSVADAEALGEADGITEVGDSEAGRTDSESSESVEVEGHSDADESGRSDTDSDFEL